MDGFPIGFDTIFTNVSLGLRLFETRVRYYFNNIQFILDHRQIVVFVSRRNVAISKRLLSKIIILKSILINLENFSEHSIEN